MPMPRSRSMGRRIGFVVVAEPWDVVRDLERELAARLPSHRIFLRATETGIVVPPPHEVWTDGRVLRGEEYLPFDRAVADALGAIDVTAVWLALDHMYLLDWHAFDDAAYRELDAVYRRLPGWLGTNEARWFSADDDAQHLWASVEPPGLQVGGLCDAARFDAWCAAFESLTAGLPFRDS